MLSLLFLFMIQQIYWMWIDLFVQWGTGVGCLENNTANHLISGLEKCTSWREKSIPLRTLQMPKNNNKNMNLMASLLLADFEVSARFKREIVNEYFTKSFWTDASLIFTVSAHSCCFADLTLTTWQVTARQMYLTMITFPVFLSFLFSVSLSNHI